MSTDTHQSAGGTEFQPGQVLGRALAHSANAAPSGDGIKPALPSAAPDTKEQEIKLKFAEETHQYVRDYIRQADQKATFLFAGSSTLLAYLNSISVAQSWLSNPKTWGPLDVLSFLATSGLMLGAACCAFVITPRLGGSKRGLVFFSAIQEYETPAEYAIELQRGQLNSARRNSSMSTSYQRCVTQSLNLYPGHLGCQYLELFVPSSF